MVLCKECCCVLVLYFVIYIRLGAGIKFVMQPSVTGKRVPLARVNGAFNCAGTQIGLAQCTLSNVNHKIQNKDTTTLFTKYHPSTTHLYN